MIIMVEIQITVTMKLIILMIKKMTKYIQIRSYEQTDVNYIDNVD